MKRIISPLLLFALLFSMYCLHQRQTVLRELAAVQAEIERLKALPPGAVKPLEQKTAACLPCPACPVAGGVSQPLTGPINAVPGASGDDGSDAAAQEKAAQIEGRIAAVRKVMPLTPEQEALLRERLGQADNTLANVLEQTLGSDIAAFYLQARSHSFEKSERRELEKDVLYLSRFLQLDAAQEQEVRNAFFAVRSEAADREAAEKSAGPAGPRERMTELLRRSQLERELLRARLSTVLTPQQFAAYLADEAQSPAADMELWHGAQDTPPPP